MRSIYILLILFTAAVVHAQDTLQADTAAINANIRQGKALVYEYPDSARIFFQQALQLAEAGSSRTHHASALNWMGVMYYILGEYNAALPYFTHALRLSERAKDDTGIATSLNHIGLIYEMQGEHEKAIEQHERAIVHAERSGNTERLASNHFNIGLIYDETGKHEQALASVNKALTISEANRHFRLVAMCYNRLGEIYFHLGRLKDAEALYRKALAYPQYQSNWENAFANAGLAQTLRGSGRLTESATYGREAYRLARLMNAKWEVTRAADILSQIYADQKNYKQAYDMQRIARQVSDSVFNEEKEKELNYVHLQENELQKLRLTQQNELQQAELRYKNLFITLGAIVLASLLVISIILYTRQRQKVRLNRKLSTINQQFEQQNIQLNELNQTKSNLLSIIGHDMRSPLVNLGALLNLIQQDDLEPATRQRFLSELHVAVDSLSGTLDNLLHWATSQMDGFKTNPVIIDLDHVMEGKIRLWQNAAKAKNINVRHLVHNLNAYADINQVRAIMRNLVGNAIKFTPSGGEITIAYRVHAGMVGVMISDTGVGIAPDKLHELFTFKPGRQTRGTENEKGSGLGLMITKQFVEQNNGKIKVDSTPGKGTTFTVWLPKAE